MKTGDWNFTTILSFVGKPDCNGHIITEEAMREAFKKLEGKTVALTNNFNASQVLGVANEFKEVPGLGFTIGGIVRKSAINDLGITEVVGFDLDYVSITEDYNIEDNPNE